MTETPQETDERRAGLLRRQVAYVSPALALTVARSVRLSDASVGYPYDPATHLVVPRHLKAAAQIAMTETAGRVPVYFTWQQVWDAALRAIEGKKR